MTIREYIRATFLSLKEIKKALKISHNKLINPDIEISKKDIALLNEVVRIKKKRAKKKLKRKLEKINFQRKEKLATTRVMRIFSSSNPDAEHRTTIRRSNRSNSDRSYPDDVSGESIKAISTPMGGMNKR